MSLRTSPSKVRSPGLNPHHLCSLFLLHRALPGIPVRTFHLTLHACMWGKCDMLTAILNFKQDKQETRPSANLQPPTDWTQEESQIPGGTTHLWEESWDDDDTSEDFAVQLRYGPPFLPHPCPSLSHNYIPTTPRRYQLNAMIPSFITLYIHRHGR